MNLSTWQLVAAFTGTLIIYQLVSLLRTWYRTGLRDIPGPWLASMSNLDRLISCAKGMQMDYHIRLHEKYGPLVRIGPSHVSISDGSLIPQIYGITSRFYKSDFYAMFDIKAPSGMVPTIFSVRDEDRHKAIKRPVANAFSMSTMKELEPMNDDCSAILIEKLEGMVGQDIDLGKWVHVSLPPPTSPPLEAAIKADRRSGTLST
jgi:hypothetical protein